MIRCIGILLLLASCTSGIGKNAADNSASPWSLPGLAEVLRAQDQRDAAALCTFLGHKEAHVRQRAALAFASLAAANREDGFTANTCLLNALQDEEPSVRIAAIHALGYSADSVTTVKMAELSLNEIDTSVQRAYFSAGFIAAQRNGMLNPASILYMIETGSPADRIRAADALRRLPDTTLRSIGPELDTLLTSQPPEVLQFLILAVAKRNDANDADVLNKRVTGQGDAGLWINTIRGLARMQKNDDDLLLTFVKDPYLQVAVLEALATMDEFDAGKLLKAVDTIEGTGACIQLLGLVLKHGNEDHIAQARILLDTIAQTTLTTYQKADLIHARAMLPTDTMLDDLEQLMRSDAPAPERLAAFQASVKIVREIMIRSRFASPTDQYAQLGQVIRTALSSGDEGLIAAASEELLNEEREAIEIMVDADVERQARSALLPVRDLEALLLLDKLAAKRSGLPPPVHRAPKSDRPIDVDRLRSLGAAPRYLIKTTKGEITIELDPANAPTSCLAFDSLVSAGFYNGKAFHRVVPNFVIQGGCPRGDGYGGMPWTLRTEIGLKYFTAGSVGLASAGPDTEGSQFFITHSATPHLDGRYTCFGEVVSGMDVVWKLQVGDVMEKVEKVD